MAYSEKDILGMSAERLFSELGIHRGFVGKDVRSTLSASENPRYLTLHYYHLGHTGLVGVEDGQWRRCLPPRVLPSTLALEEKPPDAPYLGPVQCAFSSIRVAEKLKAVALPALVVLNGKDRGSSARAPTTRPRILLKSRIAAVDAPDVGIEVRVGLRSKPLPFRLKGRG